MSIREKLKAIQNIYDVLRIGRTIHRETDTATETIPIPSQNGKDKTDRT